MNRDDIIVKVKKLSKAVDIKKACINSGLKSSSNFWTGKVSKEKAIKIYGDIVMKIRNIIDE